MKLVGRYQVGALIGQGAMANVYRAYDPGINRVLAIKVLKRQFCRDAECAARFLREAKAAGALSHRNIVTIYDVGEIEGFPYIAMELLEGEPLDKALARRGQFSPAEVIEIGSQLADALRYAHDEGVVHRDIKPSNIVLGKGGGPVKILDFGIARVGESAPGQADLVQTQVGQVLGTPRYMSPEQAMGRALDGRSDLFSVGAILYELITGKPAFDGASAATLALQITQLTPAPIDVTPECPRGLKFIISKLLEKRPEKRFADGGRLLDALQREQAANLVSASEGRPRRLPFQLRATLLMTAIMAGVLALSIGFVVNRQYRAMEQVALTSGSTIASFVANNVALHMVENAARPAEERDWVPVQAFINSASNDPNITQMTVVDRDGVIRAASDPEMVGARYLPPIGQQRNRENAQVAYTNVRGSNGVESFRFAHTISYSNRSFGLVDVNVRKTELQAAASLVQWLLIWIGLLGTLVVMVQSAIASRFVLQPIRRLKAALDDAAKGDIDFRISHNRRDEFGDLFDSYNTFISAVQRRLDAAAGPVAPLDLGATMIAPRKPANDLAPDAKRGAQ